MGFFLDAPPNFVPFQFSRALKIYSRNLPHWRQEGCTYFVTFRTADSLPARAIRRLMEKRKDWDRENPPPHAGEQVLERLRLLSILEERWLDAGHGDCPFRIPLARNEVVSALLHHEQRHMTMAFVCMPNHVHALLHPQGMSLENSLKRIKGRSAVAINRVLGRSGKVWQHESHDRIVRDRKHLWKCLQYIGRNPKTAKLREGEYTRWVCPEWEERGWGCRQRV